MLPSKRIPLNIPVASQYTNACSTAVTVYLLALLLAASFLLSCSGAAKQRDKDAAGSAAIKLPAPSPITTAETEKYKMLCEQWYDSVLKNRGFNGAIIVAKKGNVVFERYQGTGHMDGTDTITAVTPFHIASVSKTFTAMTVLKLWQAGKLNLDDEFTKYFPAFNYPGVTIRSLLNHRSGLPNYVYFMETLGWDKKIYIRNGDVLNYLITRKAEIKNIASPNTHFTYCNTNYALLALLIEKLSGTSYAAYLQQTFFTPLSMKNTFVFDTSRLTSVNPSYDWRGKMIGFNFLDAVYGDKNIYSTAHDLLIWDRVLYSSKLFTQKTLDEAFAPYSNEKPGIRNYGLGWRMNIYPNGKKMIYHNGWWHGNNASFIRLTADSATIIVLSSKFNRGVYHAKDLAAVFSDYGSGLEEEEEAIVNSPKMAPAHTPKKMIAAPVKIKVKPQRASKKIKKRE